MHYDHLLGLSSTEEIAPKIPRHYLSSSVTTTRAHCIAALNQHDVLILPDATIATVLVGVDGHYGEVVSTVL